MNSQKRTLVQKVISVVNLILFITFCLIGFFYGDKVKAPVHKNVVDFLISISSILFGITGAWLSLSKAEIEMSINDASENHVADQSMKRARNLVSLITIPSLVLVFSIIYILLFYIAPYISFVANHILLFKTVSFILLCIGMYGLLFSVILIISEGASYLLGLSEINQRRRAARSRRAHMANSNVHSIVESSEDD